MSVWGPHPAKAVLTQPSSPVLTKPSSPSHPHLAVLAQPSCPPSRPHPAVRRSGVLYSLYCLDIIKSNIIYIYYIETKTCGRPHPAVLAQSSSPKPPPHPDFLIQPTSPSHVYNIQPSPPNRHHPHPAVLTQQRPSSPSLALGQPRPHQVIPTKPSSTRLFSPRLVFSQSRPYPAVLAQPS